MAGEIDFDIARQLITKLSSPALSQFRLWWNLRHDIDDFQHTVSTIDAVLLDAAEKSVTSNHKVWLEKLKDLLHDADDLLDDFSTEALRKDLMGGNKLTKEVRLFFSSSNQFAYGFKMGREIKAIKARLDSLKSEANTFCFFPLDQTQKRQQTHSFVSKDEIIGSDRPAETSFMTRKRQQTHSFVNKYQIIGRDEHEGLMETSFMTKKRRETHSFVNKDQIIGRDGDRVALLNLMLRFESEENVYIIPIVGLGGLGKTALAQFIYNDETVKHHFELMMWVSVSYVFDVKKIVENIIKSATGQAPYQNLEMDQLQKQLRDKIDGTKYLLVLDDIWNEDEQQWLRLKNLLMGGAKGSRIIVTTRSSVVANITNKCQSYVLKRLSDDDAWFLFKEIAFEQRYADLTNPAFVEIGKQILERCGGVPLVIRTIASTLSYKETENEWRSFKDNEFIRIFQNENGILSTLKLSYDHLPFPLKHCFTYCRLYPKDHVIHVKTLVQFWIAQGYVKQLNLSQSLEEIGFGYFNDLVDRSFFQEVGERFPGEGLTCKVNNLMHDLAESVAGKESRNVDSNKIAGKYGKKCRHLSINPSSILLFNGKELSSKETWDLIIANCRYLRVLESDDIDFKMIPRSIYMLKYLRFLDLSQNRDLKILPKSICKLHNLQVLKLDRCWELEELPKNIEKLVNLTHLGCEDCNGLTHMPRGIGKLSSLETLSMFVVDKDGSHGGADLSELTGLNNLRGELRITNLGFVKNAKEKFKAANLKEKQHLKSLVLEWGFYFDDNDDDDKSLEDLQPHPNLKGLCIRGWRGDVKFPSWLSLLTNLVHIKIWGLSSKFKHLPSFAQFPCLQDLVICDLTELEYMDDNSPKGSQGELESFFPSLKYLCLRDCPNMKSWWRTTKAIGDDSKEYDATVMGTSTMAFPCLSCLKIENCPLTSMPLYPSLDDWLKLVNTSLRPLKQTTKMNMNAKTPSTSTSSLPLSKLKSFHVDNIEGLDTHMLDECLQHLTGIKSLTIRDCKELDLEGMQWEPLKNVSRLMIDKIPQLVSLPRGLQHLVQLKTLEIHNCSGLRSLPVFQQLPPVFQHLTSLEEFEVRDCKELELSAADFQIFQDHTNLRYLTLENIPKCRHLPEWRKNFHNNRRNSPIE
ncbi:Putative disease resistance RGA3 [Gossypium arboreum]|uniref:Putative disease resistance RGA3 n=1 Tax=Gossypium arboreum TaxID=29729 RepID=A0A0B0P9G6_GOSAR|nr:Putative disease resistance RGA3 [Gossypium arboreum]